MPIGHPHRLSKRTFVQPAFFMVIGSSSRVVFNVAGNQYRLVVKINYPYRVVYIRFIGTHTEYDAIDVTNI
jgi:mRNA-degrading endonuclease HigB of HigAB toxin-antitoxin module